MEPAPVMFRKIKPANGYLLQTIVQVTWLPCRSIPMDPWHLPPRSFSSLEKVQIQQGRKSSHVHSTIFSPDEKFLLTANLGTDQEHVYAFNPSENIPLTEAHGFRCFSETRNRTAAYRVSSNQTRCLYHR